MAMVVGVVSVLNGRVIMVTAVLMMVGTVHSLFASIEGMWWTVMLWTALLLIVAIALRTTVGVGLRFVDRVPSVLIM